MSAVPDRLSEHSVEPFMKGVWHAFNDIVLARLLPTVVFGLMALLQGTAFAHRLQLGPGEVSLVSHFSVLLQKGTTVAFVTFMAMLFLVRRSPVGPRSPLSGALVALGGTFVITVPVGAKVVEENVAVLLVSSVLTLSGMGWSLVSLAFLGRCFGLFPEARGLVTRGPYRWIRHPLYLGELVAIFGLVLATLSAPLLALFLVTCGLQYWRAINEERALTQVFPEYAEYCRRTYRLLPGVH